MNVITLTDMCVNTYLVSLGNGWCLVDTGYPQQEKKFWKRLEERKIDPKDIKYVFLTHHHADHAGFLASVLEKTGARLISSERNSLRLAAGKNDLQTYISSFPMLILSKISVAFVDLTQCFPPVTAPSIDPTTQPLKEYGIFFKVLKGHTECDVVMQAGDKLFCGDLFMNGAGALKYAPMWIKNKFEMVKSWEKVTKMTNVKTVFPGHGKPFDVSRIPKAIEYWKDKGVLTL